MNDAETDVAGDLALGANRPLLLADAARSWLVVRGVVEVFAIGRDSDSPTARLHLGTTAAGGRFFGIEDDTGRGIRLLAVGGVDTVVRSAPAGEPAGDDRLAWIGALPDAASGDAQRDPAAPITDTDPIARLRTAVEIRRAEIESDGLARVRAQRGGRTSAMANGLERLRSLVDRQESVPVAAEGDDPIDAAF